jgi:hypothetical protein
MMKGFPRRSYYGKNHVAPTRGGTGGTAPATKKQINSFEQEYQKFIADLKAKKEDEAKKAEAPVLTEEPKAEAEVIPETVTTLAEDVPVLNEETQPKKTKKKKAEPVVETVAEPTIDGLD